MADGKPTTFTLSCPAPRVADDRIVLAHGGGGRLTHQLIEKIFLPAFSNAALDQRHDGAVLPLDGMTPGSRLAFTTDSFVVRPLIFPGGNIGDLAINGTVNDLAMCGARPLYLSAGFILEEGLEMETLRTVVKSMQEAAAKAGVQLVTGDTKVVDKGKGDGIFINTSGIGVVESRTGLINSFERARLQPRHEDHGLTNGVEGAPPHSLHQGPDLTNGFERARLQPRHQEPTTTRALAPEGGPTIGPAAVQPGDAVIISGDLGRHGIAILSVREGLAFESPILSDTASVWPAVEALLNAGIEIHCLRDLTRGGLATTLNEIASDRNVCIQLEETRIPVDETVQSACEIFGLDPLYVANEGRFAVFVPEVQASAALGVLGRVPVSEGSVRVGKVEETPGRTVVLQSRIGGNRVVDMLSGEQLPRIC